MSCPCKRNVQSVRAVEMGISGKLCKTQQNQIGFLSLKFINGLKKNICVVFVEL